jgi:glycosyltransferase involved in cell wall biosynthesis
MKHVDETRLRIAFANIETAGWTAGGHYLRNVFAALRCLEPQRRPEIILLESEGHGEQNSLVECADHIVMRPKVPYRYSLQQRVARRLPGRIGRLLESKPPLTKILHQSEVKCLFSLEMFGPKFDLPIVSWIPDFQHMHLPQMFSGAEIRERDQLFCRISAEASTIVVSSKSALHDFERFIDKQAFKARLASFVAQIPANIYDIDPATVCARYHLPQRFFYLPNQFWKHKNHQIIVEALAIAVERHPEVTVVCTGNTYDHRHPHYFAQLLATIAERDLRNNILILGLIPHHHTFQLTRQALAVLQPSLFEGWSTTVEEAKSIGKRVIASDIPTHREQDAPQAHYFDPRDPEALAFYLVDMLDNAATGPDTALERTARKQLPGRMRIFGETLLDIFEKTAAI